MRDFIAATRSLRKNPGFTVAVIAMLAVGIGATTAMFSVADGVLFAPLPYANENRLVAIVNHGTRRGNNMSVPDLFDVRHGVKSLDEVGAVYAGPGLLTGEGDPLEVGKGAVSANWFSMLGVRPEIGRFFVPGEDEAGAAKVVVINDELWRTRFGADRAVLGRTITVDGESRVVIGVASSRTSFPYKLGTWIPITNSPSMLVPARRGNRYYQVTARVADGVPFAQARAEFKTFTARLHEVYPVPETGLDYDLMPLREQVVGDAKPALLVMVAAVSFILLIACANVAGLLLLRARQRSQEMGIRLALGASPQRVIREMLAESLVYGAIGGALGVVLAEFAVRGIVAMRPVYLPFVDDIAVDWRVLTFAIVVTLVTAVVFGIAPAIFASQTDLVGALTSGTRSTTAGKRSTTLRQTFVVFELALALVLLVGAGLLGKSFEKLMAVNTGFQPVGLMHFDMGPPSYPAPSGATTAADSSAQSRAAIDAYLKDLRPEPRWSPRDSARRSPAPR
jgi:putative ABC transport system permease protein